MDQRRLQALITNVCSLPSLVNLSPRGRVTTRRVLDACKIRADARTAGGPMETRASVVIIGAGIVGSAAAHVLSDHGWRDVVVVDQGPIFATGGSTSDAPGLVFQTNGSKTMTQFARETVELFASLEHDGQPCWHGVGSLEVATTPARWADLHRKLGWAKSWGLDASLLTPAETRARLDLIDESVILGAYCVPTDGVAKPVWAAEELARATRGVAFYPRTAVLGIEAERG